MSWSPSRLSPSFGSQLFGFCQSCGLYTGKIPNGRLIDHFAPGLVSCEGRSISARPPPHPAWVYGVPTRPPGPRSVRVVTISCGHDFKIRSERDRLVRRCRVCHQVSTVAA